MNVRFCPSCRGLILSDYRFCPYCGVAIKGPELADALDGAFEGMAGGDAAERPGGARDDVFAKAEKSLERLEADMDLILEALEREGRSPK